MPDRYESELTMDSQSTTFEGRLFLAEALKRERTGKSGSLLRTGSKVACRL